MQASFSLTISWSLLRLKSIESMMPSNHLILYWALLLRSVFPSIRVFPMSQFFPSGDQSIGASASASGLISYRIDWFGLLAVQGTLKSLLQHHSLKPWCSAFFTVQLSHLYMITGKIIPLTIQTFVSKAMSLLFNMLSRFVIAFLPRNKSLNFVVAVTVLSDSNQNLLECLSY